MTEANREFIAKTLVFKHGTEVVIWGIPLDTLEIDEHELDEYLADGWHQHPFHARDAHAAEQSLLAEQAAEAQRVINEKAEADKKLLQGEADAEAERVRLKKKADEDSAAENQLRNQLLAEAETLKVKIDKRWGVATLQEAIDEAKKAK